jgi:hypothetical protein
MARQKEFLDHLLECPHCGTIRLRIPKDADGSTIIRCSDCNRLIGTWDEIRADFDDQGGQVGVFKLAKGKIKRLE